MVPRDSGAMFGIYGSAINQVLSCAEPIKLCLKNGGLEDFKEILQ